MLVTAASTLTLQLVVAETWERITATVPAMFSSSVLEGGGVEDSLRDKFPSTLE